MQPLDSNNPRILITGSNGRLAGHLRSLCSCTAIDRSELDITDAVKVADFFREHTFDILIHCAAYTDVAGAEKDKKTCYRVNVQGTENLIKHFNGSKFVYISTEYVFDGTKGNYREDDIPNPVNYYALTKLLGEMIVRQYPNSLIIRTSFKPDGPWPYPKAFTDQWTSADYASERAPQILKASIMTDLFGVIHIGGTRKSIYDLAKKQTPQVGAMSIHDVSTVLPQDVSLNSDRWNVLHLNGQG